MQTVLITGSTRGIGESCAQIFASKGYNVVLNYKNSDDKAISLSQELEKKYGIETLRIKCDITNEEEIKKMMEQVKAKFDKITCLVNNAGIALDNSLENKSKREFLKVIETNLVGTFLVTKYASLIMNEGSIINVSSNGATTNGYIESCDYDASKAGIISLTHDFAKSLAPRIRVNCILPGWVETNMNKDIDYNFKREQMAKCLLNRFAQAEEIARVIFFLASEDASFINDAIINVDGGLK